MSRFATWAALFFVSAVVYSIANRLRQWLRLRHVPGPTIAGFSKIWVLNLCWRGTFFEGLGQVCKEYGKFFNLDPVVAYFATANPVQALWCESRQTT
jgi:hypothetical protein